MRSRFFLFVLIQILNNALATTAVRAVHAFLLSFGLLAYTLITEKLYIIQKVIVNSNTFQIRQVMNIGDRRSDLPKLHLVETEIKSYQKGKQLWITPCYIVVCDGIDISSR